MRNVLLALLLIILLKTSCFATLTTGYVPCVLTGGTNPTEQNCSIYDSGSSVGAGNVGIGTTVPGTTLDVQGTVRSFGFKEVGMVEVTSSNTSFACFNNLTGQLINKNTSC